MLVLLEAFFQYLKIEVVHTKLILMTSLKSEFTMKFSLCFCAGENQARRLLLSDGVCSLFFFVLC